MMQCEAQEVDKDKIDKIGKKIRYIHYLYNYRSLLCFQVSYPCKRDWMKNDYFITLIDHFFINSEPEFVFCPQVSMFRYEKSFTLFKESVLLKHVFLSQC